MCHSTHKNNKTENISKHIYVAKYIMYETHAKSTVLSLCLEMHMLYLYIQMLSFVTPSNNIFQKVEFVKTLKNHVPSMF